MSAEFTPPEFSSLDISDQRMPDALSETVGQVQFRRRIPSSNLGEKWQQEKESLLQKLKRKLNPFSEETKNSRAGDLGLGVTGKHLDRSSGEGRTKPVQGMDND